MQFWNGCFCSHSCSFLSFFFVFCLTERHSYKMFFLPVGLLAVSCSEQRKYGENSNEHVKKKKHKNKGLMSKLMALNARLKVWFICLLFPGKRQRITTKCKILWWRWRQDPNFFHFFSSNAAFLLIQEMVCLFCCVDPGLNSTLFSETTCVSNTTNWLHKKDPVLGNVVG